MTDDQRKEFDEWLGLDEREFKNYLRRLQNVDYVEGGLREFQKYNSVEDWKKLQAKLQVSRQKNW